MFDEFMGNHTLLPESHQSQKTLTKCSLYHSGEKVGVVVIGDTGAMILTRTGQSRIRLGQGNGEKVWRNMGDGGYWLILGSKSQSQAAGLGMGLFPDGIQLVGVLGMVYFFP